MKTAAGRTNAALRHLSHAAHIKWLIIFYLLTMKTESEHRYDIAVGNVANGPQTPKPARMRSTSIQTLLNKVCLSHGGSL